jgi:outer membrane protein insertion porin family
MKQYRYYFFICSLIVLSACNTKFLPKGEMLYVGANVKIENDSLTKSQKKALRTELNTLPRPKPNSSFLGLKPKLFAFNIAGTPKRPKGLRNWLKNKIGEPPVLARSVDLKLNREILQNRLENRGFYQVAVTSYTTSRKLRLRATYIATPGIQYRIKAVTFSTDSSELGKAVTATYTKSLLKPGAYYNLNAITSERSRIDQTLKEEGFYYFNPDYLLIKVDSTIGNHQVNLYMTIKPEIPTLAKKRYVIGPITIYPNYSLAQTRADTAKNDAVLFDGFYVIDKDSTFKPSVFSRSMFFKSGELYNRSAHNLSLNRLISIGSFKLVTNRFERDKNAPKPTLDAFYYLTPLPRKSIRTELLGTTKSTNLTGTELSVSWRNRNTFRGAEQLIIRVYGSYEWQISGTQLGYNTLRLGTESTLSFPKFIVPFFSFNTANAFVPRTKFTLGYELLNKPLLYTLRSFRALAGYTWKESTRKEHELNLVSVNFVQPTNITSEYQDSINENPILAKTIERQFIVGSTYSFTYTDQLEVTRRNTIYFNGNIDLAGNLLGLIQGANYKTGDTATIFGVRYSQYAKMDGDFRYYLKTGRHSKLVGRIFAGVGIPIGNSSELPYIKQYFAGGTNSNRAFLARSIGPGTYREATSSLKSYTPDQSGDIKLELNAEFRAKLVGIVYGALFVDAGNVWLFNDDPDKPGAKFSKDFLNELAVGTGFGLRFDLSFLVLRTDLGFPIHKPWLVKGDRWVFDQIDVASKLWREDNLVFNLAIGYPF